MSLLRPAAIRVLSGTLVFAMFSSSAMAASISYLTTPLGGNSWRYDYWVDNTSAPVDFDEVTIFFDSTRFSSLRAATAPTAWDLLVVQPDLAIPADGFLDGIRLAGSFGAQAAQLFSITFDYAGIGAPASQRFELIDSATFAVRESGLTLPAAVPAIPEPRGLALLGVAMIAALRTYQARRSNSGR